MNATLFNILMIVAFALSGLFLVAAVILFFKLGVKSAIDELSGKRARKQIAEFRKENTATKSRGYVPGIFDEKETKNTASLNNKATGQVKRNTAQLSTSSTEKIDDIVDESGGTVLLRDVEAASGWDEGTSVLGASDMDDDEGTTILVDEDEGTTLLTEETDGESVSDSKCSVIREIVVLEAEEYIEVE